MKALDILIYILDCGGMIHVDRGFMSNVSKAVGELKEHISGKDAQIKWLREELKYHEAELEALQQRSCEECVHRSFIDEALTNKVTNGFCIENGFFTKRDFCCNRYEAKEQ